MHCWLRAWSLSVEQLQLQHFTQINLPKQIAVRFLNSSIVSCDIVQNQWTEGRFEVKQS